MLWAGAALIILFLVVQAWGGEYIAWLYLKVRWVWLKIFTLVWPKESMVTLIDLIDTRHVREWNGEQLAMVSNELRFVMFPFWGWLVYHFGMKAIKKNPGNKYKRKLNRASLAEAMAADFPWTLPALKQDLVKIPIDKGAWSMADRPIDFIRRYALVNGRTLSRERAEKLFSSQLGRLWTGPDNLNKNAKALFACFAAQICDDKDAAVEVLMGLARTVSSGVPDYAPAFKLLEKHKNDKRVLEVCKKHSYQYTVLIAMFSEAKKVGIMPPNFFLWLKPTNRVLWFTLNCVRRRTPFSEVAGIYAHYYAEVISGHGIEKPYVIKAVDALEKSLRDVRFEPITEDQNREALRSVKR